MKHRAEVEPSIRRNLGVIESLKADNARMMDELVSGLTVHEGQTRYVWGRAIINGVVNSELAVVTREPLYIEKSGLATPEEAERFGVIALVKTIQQPEDLRLVRFFDPFQHGFHIEPTELDESQSPS